ncbi:MAG: tRNA lysidine(34) synthetase TilS [Candidatus Marinimicrobia bacterium]|nr:tRNA lysidine(34) synthetase TilS [Candidatus Neomarinimicrobiota bacterium]
MSAKPNNSYRNSLYQQFCQNVEVKWDSFHESSVLLAVSGGSDSISMLHLFHRFSQDQDLRISIAHVNHHLRPDSDAEADFVRKLCQKLHLTYWELALDPAEKSPAVSTEAWAREERYRVLQELCKIEKYDFIATAHHLNDQAETVLMRVGEGSGIEGLQGIREQRGNIIRPLLSFDRSALEKYNNDKGFKWVEDSSNADINIPRNYIRHIIVKRWQKDNPNLLEAIQFLCERATDYDNALKFILDRIHHDVIQNITSNSFRLDGKYLSELPRLLKLAIIRKLIGGNDPPWRRHHWNSLHNFLVSPSTGRFHELPGGWILLSDRGNWLLSQDTESKQYCQPVVRNSKTTCGYFLLKWRSVKEVKQFTGTPWIEYIDEGFLQGKSLIIRTWQPGDRFQPLGMQGRKKISDFLIDEQVDRFQKKRQLVLMADEEIIWVCGRRISNLVRITPHTQSIVELSIERKVGK